MKKVISLLVVTMLLLLCSCKAAEEVNDPDYSAFSPTFYNNETTDTTAENVTDDMDNSIDNISQDINNSNDSEWPYELNFTGVTSTVKGKTGNLGSNYKLTSIYSSLVCPDIDNGVTYYINYGNDNYIYQLKDGISTLLLDKEAYYLQLWDNELYFLSSSHNYEDINTGDLYSINLDTKELRLVLKEDIYHFLNIDSYGIYFVKALPTESTNTVMAGYKLDFNSNTPHELDFTYPISFNEYLIHTIRGDGLFLHNRETEETHYIAPYHIRNQRISIYENYLVFTNIRQVCMLNLENGEKHIYEFNEPDTYDMLMDYVIVDNVIYAVYGSESVLKYDIATNTLEIYGVVTEPKSVAEEEIGIFNSLHAIFTDGNNLFAILNKNDHDRLVQVFLTQNNGKNTLTIKELGK